MVFRLAPGRNEIRIKEERTSAKAGFLFLALGTLASLATAGSAFFGIWRAQQACDDVNAYMMLEAVSNGNPDALDSMRHLLTATNGGGTLHWIPITNIFQYILLKDDSLEYLVFVSLGLVVLTAVFSGYFSGKLGATPIGSLFTCLLISSSQSLVFPIATSWGVTNILPSIFTVGITLILYSWLTDKMNINTNSHTVLLFSCYSLLLLLAMLTKEGSIRCIIICFGICIYALVVNHTRDCLREIFILLLLTLVCVLLYLMARYYWTDAVIPFIRSTGLKTTDYRYPVFSPATMIRNTATLLLGSLSPVDSYWIYLTSLRKESLKFVLLLLPAFVFGLALFVGLLRLCSGRSGEPRVVFVVICLSLFSSLFPEILLKKVSEMYAMNTLWPVAVLSGIVLSDLNTKGLLCRSISMLIATFLIAGNIFSSQTKVTEILKTGQNAHSIRESMQRLTQDLPPGSRIAVFRNPRSREAFGRFGVKGMESNYKPWIPGTSHLWKEFRKGETTDTSEHFDLILEESEDLMTLRTANHHK
jgi:hypothetical protein